MAESLDRVTGANAARRITWEVDPAVEAIVATWPARVRAARASSFGLEPEVDFDQIVRDHIAVTGSQLPP